MTPSSRVACSTLLLIVLLMCQSCGSRHEREGATLDPFDDMAGLWLAEAQPRPGSEADAVAEEWAAEAWLALWPDGRFSMLLGPACYYGKWNLTGSNLRLSVEWSVAWPPGGTGSPVAMSEVYPLAVKGDTAVLSEAPDGSPMNLLFRRARKLPGDDMSRYIERER